MQRVSHRELRATVIMAIMAASVLVTALILLMQGPSLASRPSTDPHTAECGGLPEDAYTLAMVRGDDGILRVTCTNAPH